MKPLHLGAIALAFACAASTANAASTTASCVITSSVDLTQSCLASGVPTFDPQLGRLMSVTLTSTLKGWGTFGLIDYREDPALPAAAEFTAFIEGATVFMSTDAVLDFWDDHYTAAAFQHQVGGSGPIPPGKNPTYFWDWTLESVYSNTLTDAASLAAFSQTGDLFYPVAGGGYAEGRLTNFPGPVDDISQSAHHYVLNVSFNYAAVPEPATWAMMIVGFGLAGSSLRSVLSRRPRQQRLPLAS